MFEHVGEVAGVEGMAVVHRVGSDTSMLRRGSISARQDDLRIMPALRMLVPFRDLRRAPMRFILKWLLRLLLVVVLLGAAFFVHVWYFKPAKIDWYYNRVFAQFALDNPEILTSLRILDQYGLNFTADELSDSSLESENRQIEKLKKNYDTFVSYGRENYQGQELISYDIWDFFMKGQVDNERWRWHNYPVNQMFGVQSSLPNFMADQHLVFNERDGDNYVARLNQFPKKFTDVIEGLKMRDSKGVLPRQFTVEKVLKQMRGFIEPKPAEHMLATTFAKKLEKIKPEDMDQATRDRLQSAVAAAIETSVYPAYRNLIAYYEEIAPRATSNDGVWSLPDGEEYYAYEVFTNTTTKMSVDEIHALGLSEVQRIATEMDQILQGAGYTEGTIGLRIRALGDDPSQLYPDTAEGREQIIKDYTRIITEINQGLDQWFAVKPKAGVQVQRVPEFSEATAPGAYYQPPSLDGARPGTFYANLRNVKEVSKFGMRTLAYHEAVPGHHFQIAIAQELKGLPMFRKLIPFTAYAEGWALYSERVAWEAGFQSNPLDNLGRLQAEMFRAVRLVVDTGLHAKRWTREQAIGYMIDHTGMGDDEVTAEIERYLVNPGQALAYKVGMIKILDLRQRAKDALGDKFDIREFHDQVLKNGSMPLTVLERVIEEWIASKNSGTALAAA
jgi:uncharacterized protein (DUF885 family)